MGNAILAFGILGNILNLAYNVPFVWVVMKHWNANNISKKFLYIRVCSSLSWIIYGILSSELYIGLAYTVTLISSLLVSYVKITQVKSNKTREKTSIRIVGV